MVNSDVGIKCLESDKLSVYLFVVPPRRCWCPHQRHVLIGKT